MKVRKLREDEYEIVVEVVPTVPHCSLATLIGMILNRRDCYLARPVLSFIPIICVLGLCIRVKLHEYLLCNYKVRN